MDPVRVSVQRPVAVTVGALLVVIFGLIGLAYIPIQLTPTVDRPIVRVTTSWPGRSPEEIVDSITCEQEKRLKNVSGLRSMRSLSREGQAEITLEFYLGTDLGRALLEINDALRQVPSYPPEVEEPVVKASEGASETAIAWIIIDLDPSARARFPDFDVATIWDALERDVKPYLERIEGVAEVNIYGGRPHEVRVLVDPWALARRGLTHADVVRALLAENRNVSAGTIVEGKRDYRVRLLGRFESPQDIAGTVIAYRDGHPVYVRDVGQIEIGLEKPRGFVRSMGEPCLAMNVIRQTGANVMEVMAEVRRRLEVVRRDMLPRTHPVVGPHLRLRQVYDETTYISQALDLVTGNLVRGGALAALVLLLFLRSLRSTLVVALAIPIAVIGTFLVMLATGRTLNVISLAGLAFSTGMVVDNAIVVLENIDRRRSQGEPVGRAVIHGTWEVWGAILAGTLTTVAVFVPILTIREEAGRLFFDLTLALSTSVLLSLVVATTIVPTATAVLLGRQAETPRRLSKARSLLGLAPRLARMTRAFARGLEYLMTGWRAWTVRPVVIVLLTGASLAGAAFLMPPADYLPTGNRNLVFGGLMIPPGLSVDQQKRYAERIEARIGPYLRARLEDPASIAHLPPIPRMIGIGPDGRPIMGTFDPVPVENFFVAGFGGGMFAGATSQDPQRVIPVGALLTDAMNALPDAYGGARQVSLFGWGVSAGGAISVEIAGPDLSRVRAAAKFVFGQLFADPAFGRGRVQPDPRNFDLTQPEWRLRLTQTGRELGLRTEDLAPAVRGLFDGAFAGEFLLDGRTVDIKLYPREGSLLDKEQLPDIPIVAPNGQVVPLGTVVAIHPAGAPQEILRIEELPAVTIRVNPPPDVPLGAAMERVETGVLAQARAAGLLDDSMRVRLEGTAAKLEDVRAALLGAPSEARTEPALWQRGLRGAGVAAIALGLIASGMALVRLWRRTGIPRPLAPPPRALWSAVPAALLLGLLIGSVLITVGSHPQMLLARFTWTVLVTYLLLAALFESFVYPLVVMFSVPLGLVGGFAGLHLVHTWTLRDPTIAPQQFDVLTMLGFVILVGTVVNNAILLVVQARHFMGESRVEDDEEWTALPPASAIAEAVRTRVRPIFMTTLTTIGGSLPLVLAPGAGSEMYRGLGAVVVGGLLISTLFTLVLIPLVFSVAVEMVQAARTVFRPRGPDGRVPGGPRHRPTRAGEPRPMPQA